MGNLEDPFMMGLEITMEYCLKKHKGKGILDKGKDTEPGKHIALGQ